MLMSSSTTSTIGLLFRTVVSRKSGLTAGYPVEAKENFAFGEWRQDHVVGKALQGFAAIYCFRRTREQ